MNKKILLSAVSILALTSFDAKAAGFQLGENSSIAIGRAFAGAGVVGDDLSAIALNPAGMSLFNGTMGGQVGVALVDVNADFTGTVTRNSLPPTPPTISNVSENPSTLSAVPHTYVVGKVNDKVNIGLGIHTPFGLETDYDRDWAGAFMGVRSYVMTIDVNPTISYKVTDQWSVGLGLSAQYLAATLTSNNVLGSDYFKVDGDSWAYGYNFGVMFEPVKDTRIGLSYRSKMDHDVEGDTYTTATGNDGGTTADITLPETVTLSGFHKLNEKFGLSTTFRWTNWSRFEELTVLSVDAPDTRTTENWRDTWSLGFGVDYYASPDWTFRVGIGYDRGPIKSEEFRTPRIPDNNRWQYGIGASWKMNENVSFDLGYMYLHMEDADMDHTATNFDETFTLGTITGTFEPYSHILSASMQVKF